MLRCKEVVRQVASGQLAEASWSKRFAVRLHLLMCRHCRRYAAQLRAIGTAARNLWGKNPQESADLEELENRVFVAASGKFQDVKATNESAKQPSDLD